MEQCNKIYVPAKVTVKTFEQQDVLCSSVESGTAWNLGWGSFDDGFKRD